MLQSLETTELVNATRAHVNSVKPLTIEIPAPSLHRLVLQQAESHFLIFKFGIPGLIQPQFLSWHSFSEAQLLT